MRAMHARLPPPGLIGPSLMSVRRPESSHSETVLRYCGTVRCIHSFAVPASPLGRLEKQIKCQGGRAMPSLPYSQFIELCLHLSGYRVGCTAPATELNSSHVTYCSPPNCTDRFTLCRTDSNVRSTCTAHKERNSTATKCHLSNSKNSGRPS